MNDLPMTQLKALLADESTRDQALDRLGEWAKDTCLIAGTKATTAYKVASTFVGGIAEMYDDGELVAKGWWRVRKKVQS